MKNLKSILASEGIRVSTSKEASLPSVSSDLSFSELVQGWRASALASFMNIANSTPEYSFGMRPLASGGFLKDVNGAYYFLFDDKSGGIEFHFTGPDKKKEILFKLSSGKLLNFTPETLGSELFGWFSDSDYASNLMYPDEIEN